MSSPVASHDDDERLMRRALRLAMNGRGRVEPNPMVGCVIVKNGRIIGEGFHEQFGGPHAEPNALASCHESPNGATAYVTLEPCCHSGKKTPPCAPRLIEAGIARVVVGCLDPNPQVNGAGVGMLRGAGVQVETVRESAFDPTGGRGSRRAATSPGQNAFGSAGASPSQIGPALETECRQLIAPFIAGVQHQRPYVTAKWAESANGQVAGPMGRAVRITNATSDRRVHELRSRCDAIAVGTNTVLNDDPLLTARGVEPHRKLLRVVLSNSLKVPVTSRLVVSVNEHPVVVYSSRTAVDAQRQVVADLARAGVEVVALPTRDEARFSFADVLADLHRRGVTNLLVEPGPTLCRYLLNRGQADRVWVFRSSRAIEDAGSFAVSAAPRVEYPVSGSVDLDGDTLIEYLNPESEVFFANVPSADLVLSQS